ncbi:UDP-glycosyltransferase 83A1-like [Bidens hawaiensis]|uniref:UDP-glycosyltransferase 83A1-like n=1 Tax=Bidens hawaiensis TaxID=980011 RepID=UPI00404B7EDF
MVSIPDGMEPCDDRNEHGKFIKTLFQLMPTKLEELINDINKKGDEKITCIIADYFMGWVSRVAQNMGVPLKNQMIKLSSSMPFMNPAEFIWACVGNADTNKTFFDCVVIYGKEVADAEDNVICNSTMELELWTFTLFPKMLPIGPLLATNKSTRQVGQFWHEDSTSLTWLDQQPICSVIYVAFGSFTVFDQVQFEELALGLEDTNMPSLWVVRLGTSGNIDYVYPSDYMERIGTRGKVISWAPQQEVLNHRSVACFMTHCGWNSTMEGVSNGASF